MVCFLWRSVYILTIDKLNGVFSVEVSIHNHNRQLNGVFSVEVSIHINNRQTEWCVFCGGQHT